jgi:hypothetical protein
VEVMQAEVERLQQQNERLRERGNALEGSIQEARNVVEAHKRKEQEEVCLSSGSLAPQGRIPRSNTPRASMSFSDALRSAIRAQRGPLDFSVAQTSSEATHPHQFSAASPIGARNNRFPSATYGQLQDAAYLLNSSQAGMSDISRFGQQRAVTDQLPIRSPVDVLRLSDLVGDAALSSLLLHQQAQQSYQSRPSAVAYTGVSDPRQSHLAAVAAAQAAAAADLQREGLDRLDPYELALLQLYGGLVGPPRLI